jgi:type VI secretion system protein ImpJ
MRALTNVVWSEGMYLAPHHFQRHTRYFEDCIQFAISSLWFDAYGLNALDLDAEALSNGAVSMLHASGVLSDGLPFNMPEVDALPERRTIDEHFPPARDAVTVLLAVPRRIDGGPNYTHADGDSQVNCSLRYLAETRVLQDENTGSDGRAVQLGRKNFRLVFDSESAAGLVTLPVARILRDASGQFSYDPAFVPPLLQITANPGLVGTIGRTLEMLDDKIASVGQTCAVRGAGFSTADIANFWLLHAANSAASPLRHLLYSKRGHPEELFVELSRLAGSLATFKLNSDSRQLPRYDHENLGECFQILSKRIREDLDIIVPANCLSIPLKPAGDCFYEGELVDSRCLGRSQWVLALRASVSELELMVTAPQLIKICSPPFVRELVKRALPGLALKHLSTPPPALRPNLEKQYFSISRIGPCWEHMAKTGRVGVYIPGDIPNPEAEILVILEGA